MDPIEDIQEEEMGDKVSRLFIHEGNRVQGKRFWQIRTETAFVAGSLVHACVRRWGSPGCISRHSKKVFDTKESMDRTVNYWVDKKIDRGWVEKTQDVQNTIEKIGIVSNFQVPEPTSCLCQDEETTRVALPPNWNLIKGLLSNAERAIYENYNDSKTRHHRSHLSLKYSIVFDKQRKDLDIQEARKISWHLLRAGQLRYLLSLQIYSQGRQEAGLVALDKLCSNLKKSHPLYRRHAVECLANMATKKFTTKKGEAFIYNFVEAVEKDIRLSKSIGVGGTSLGRLNLLNSLTEEDDADLVKDYG